GTLGDDLVLVLEHLRPVHGGALHVDAEVRGLEDVCVELGAPQEGLGGDAAAVEARPAQPLVPLDDGRLQPQLACTNGSHITTRTCPDNDDVIRLSHGVPPESLCTLGNGCDRISAATCRG